MNVRPEPRRSIVAESIYGLLNPIPFGCFVAALIFDIIYSETSVILWDKGAAWLVVFGLLFAVVPRRQERVRPASSSEACGIAVYRIQSVESVERQEGSTISNWAPRESKRWARSILPRCASMIVWQIGRPMPMPA